MSDTVNDVVGSLQTAAQVADDNEKTFRASIRERLEALERERVFAYRRLNLVEGMAHEAAGQDALDASVAAVIAYVAAEFALDRGRDRHEVIIDRLRPVAEAVAVAVHPPADEAAAVPDLASALAAFEAWYLGLTGTCFLARADIAVAETPLTDW